VKRESVRGTINDIFREPFPYKFFSGLLHNPAVDTPTFDPSKLNSSKSLSID
jgi:hypothetical protein